MTAPVGPIRTDWTLDEVRALFAQPFADLMFAAQQVHRAHHDPNQVQVSTLLSIKTGGCPEDCAYCPQSIRYTTDVDRHDLMPLAEVRAAAQRAKESGATRFCMGASYRGPKDSQLEPILAMIAEVKALGLETCATLGLLRPGQADDPAVGARHPAPDRADHFPAERLLSLLKISYRGPPPDIMGRHRGGRE